LSSCIIRWERRKPCLPPPLYYRPMKKKRG